MLVEELETLEEKPDIVIRSEIMEDDQLDEKDQLSADNCQFPVNSGSVHLGINSDGPIVSSVEEMKKRVLLEPLPELEVIDEAHFTWEIEGWRAMERRSHSSTFQCGGNPWLVILRARSVYHC